MRMVQFCCGGNLLEGWENHDSEIDISKPIPFSNESVDRIFIEHGIEHVTPSEAWLFLEECHRVLNIGGVIRIAFPNIVRVFLGIESHRTTPSDDAGKYIRAAGPYPVKSLVTGHGHKSVFDVDIMEAFLRSAGFVGVMCFNIGESIHPELRHLEGHGKVVGEDVNEFETSIVEATKR